jgi:catechol 2,3-dioxygenase-like lactoylglutathione lyase family enzyme
MSFTRVHHVGLVTGDLGHARHVLCDGFGLAIDEHRTPWPAGRRREADGATVIEVPIGEMYYEVAKPNGGEGDAARFLAATGGRGGMHYLAIASDDPAADLARLTARGITLQGPAAPGRPVFLDPATCLGLGIQVTPEEHYYVHPYFRGNGTVTGMAHIGIAARSAAEARHLWGDVFGLVEDTGAERGRTPRTAAERRPADDPVHLIEFPLGGTVIEISIPTTADSGTARLVAQRAPLGAVYHHTCPFAPDVHRFMEQAVAAGLEPIGTIPPREETTRVVGWLHPRSCLGMLVEVWNRPPGPGHYHPAPPR